MFDRHIPPKKNKLKALATSNNTKLFTVDYCLINPFLTNVPIWEHSFKFHFL